MAGNKNLSAANKAKKDEFYTQLTDIANELKHYRQHFKGKTVLCNCDDPYESNFFKFFAMKFNSWGLKKLICTCWGGSQVAQMELTLFADEEPSDEYGGKERVAYKIELTEIADLNGDGAIDLEDVKLLLEAKKPERLQGDGDFRSEECVELLKEADIVVTNPPFSLFREYVAQLVKYDKKFLIIGNQNAITYKEIFPLIKENKIWLGIGFSGGNAFFRIPREEDALHYAAGVYNPETGLVKFRNCCWFTNLDHKKRHEPLDLYKKYSPEEYPTYDNYDAIEVSKTVDIPMDYDGVMGVPITFLDKYCPEQFSIIWQACGNTRASAPTEVLMNLKYKVHDEDRGGCPVLNGNRTYARILIKKHDKI